MSQKDVELVIRARQEGGKALDEFTASLKELFSAQDDVKSSSGEVRSELAQLGAELTSIGREVQSLREFGRVVNNLDQAAKAVDRLEGRLAKTTAEIQQLSRAQAASVSNTAAAKSAAEKAAKAYDEQRAQAAAVKKELGATSDAYKDQAEALKAARTERDQTTGALRLAERQERQLTAALTKTAGVLDQDTRAVHDAQKAFEELYVASTQASKGFAGVAATQDNIARAADHAAEKLRLAKGAVEFRKEADEAKRLRDAADYINFWTKALDEKDAAETAAAAATKKATTTATSGRGGGLFLGLRPYELHSLSFQINDVFTQLASGTPVLQVLAQQGGQLFQVFQRQLIPVFARLAPAIAANVPEIAILIAAFAAVFAALKNIGDRAKSIREFGAEFAASADGALFNAKAVAENAHQLDVFGGSLAEARTALKAFIKEGVNPDLLEDFGRAAQNMADVTGKEVPTAAREAAEAFTAGYDAVVKLDDGLNFLSASERKHIKDLFDSGQAEKGRTEAFRIFSQRMDDGARKMRGPWSEAIHNLAVSWDNLLGFIENSAPIKGAISALGELAQLAKDLSEHLPGADERAAEAAAAAKGSSVEIVRQQRELAKLQKERVDAAEREARIAKNGGGFITGNRPNNLHAPQTPGLRSTAEIDKQIAETQNKIANLQKAIQDTLVNGSEAQKKAVQEVLDEVAREREALGDLTDQQKVRLAGEQAYQQAIRETGNVAIATARKQIAIEKVLDQQRKSINFDRLTTKIIGAETGGSANPESAKNPKSTATGLGQFIESTWLSLFRKFFPAEAQKMGEQAILDLRKDAKVSKQLVELYARENADVLQQAGVAVNDTALYLAHFLGPQGAIKVLKAAVDAPLKSLLSSATIKANAGLLAGKTAGQLISTAQAKVGNSDQTRARLDAQAEAAEILLQRERDRLKAETDFNAKIDEEVRKRNQSAQAAKDTNGLLGERLILAQREVAIREAVANAEAQATEASKAELLAGRQKIELSAAQRKAVEAAAAADFDASHAAEILAARRTDIENGVNTVLERRQTLLDAIGLAQQQGQTETASDLIQQYDDLSLGLEDATAKATEFWTALAGDPTRAAMLGLTVEQVKNIALAVQAVALQAKGLNSQFISTGKAINQEFAQRGAQAFDQFAEAVAGGASVFKSAKEAFLSFAADFLKKIALMIIEQLIFNAISGGSSGSGGIGGFVSSLVGGATKKHSGGLVGPGGLSVPAAWFANAQRYHSGGVVGLKPGEVPAILKRNEEVLTEDDPRHMFNRGAGGGREVAVRIENRIDPGDMVEAGLNTRVGEKAILNFIRANPGAVNSALGRR